MILVRIFSTFCKNMFRSHMLIKNWATICHKKFKLYLNLAWIGRIYNFQNIFWNIIFLNWVMFKLECVNDFQVGFHAQKLFIPSKENLLYK